MFENNFIPTEIDINEINNYWGVAEYNRLFFNLTHIIHVLTYI